jgi:hypothetical protein
VHLLIIFQRRRIAAEVPGCHAQALQVSFIDSRHHAPKAACACGQQHEPPWQHGCLPGAGLLGILIIFIVLLLTKLHRGSIFSGYIPA